MVNIPDLLDFCFLNAPRGYDQDSNDEAHIKEMAKQGGNVQYITFTYNPRAAISIELSTMTVLLTLELGNDRIDMLPLFEFAKKLRQYVITKRATN
jgi:hypothetical protein